jgi:hypothetical protein
LIFVKKLPDYPDVPAKAPSPGFGFHLAALSYRGKMARNTLYFILFFISLDGESGATRRRVREW